MAIYQSNLKAGDIDTNAFNSNFLTSLGRSVPGGAQLSEDKKYMSYDFSFLDSFGFFSNTGFSAPWTGTIEGIFSVSAGQITAAAQGLSVDAAALRDAIEAGDADALNALVWGGDDEITGSNSDDTLRGFGGRDVLRGGSGHDTLLGDAGHDVLRGGSGDDNLFGGVGNDLLIGGTGSDLMVGGAGRDVINGGSGTDTMRGGASTDFFKFTALNDFIGDDIDRITDFSRSQGDKIDLSQIDANLTRTGNQAFTLIDNTDDTLTEAPAAGSLVIEPGGAADTYAALLFVDGTGEFLAFLVHSADGVLTADDFIL